MTLSPKQKGVLGGMAGAVLLTLASFAVTLVWMPAMMPADPGNPALRVAFAIQADAVVFLVLAVSIGAIAQHRFMTPEDIDGSGMAAGTEKIRNDASGSPKYTGAGRAGRRRASGMGCRNAAEPVGSSTVRRGAFRRWPSMFLARLRGGRTGAGLWFRPDLLS